MASYAQRHNDETIKETIESIVIAFILAFVFRAYVVEAFVIPTGSMAPTLLGRHLPLTCQECGHAFDTDIPDGLRDATGSVAARDLMGICPMCRNGVPIRRGTSLRSGDRILVMKYVYAFSEPRRWDVVVFKAPHEPKTNFIKRLVGLPGEEVGMFDGDVFVRPEGGSWQIARKTDRLEVQRAIWQPVYHSDRLPLDGGTQGPGRTRQRRWQSPWVPRLGAESWEIEGRRSYRFDASGSGAIQFDFRAGSLDSDLAYNGPVMQYPYNQQDYHRAVDEPIRDIRLAAAFEADELGLVATLATTAWLGRSENAEAAPSAGVERLAAQIDADGQLWVLGGVPARPLGSPVEVGAFVPGRARSVELWYVDQEVSVWVDQRQVFVHRIDAPMEQVLRRPAPPEVPQVEIAVSGAPVTLHRVELDRDLYYDSKRTLSGDHGRGGFFRTSAGLIRESLKIQQDEFYCVGDNGPASLDGRFWGLFNNPSNDPWVAHRYFGDENRDGLVPRRLMIGRAFFVYYPAPYPLREGGRGLLPNFGRMRMIR